MVKIDLDPLSETLIFQIQQAYRRKKNRHLSIGKVMEMILHQKAIEMGIVVINSSNLLENEELL